MLWFFVFLAGCGKSALPPDEYQLWLSGDKDFHVSKQIDGFLFAMDFVPADWIAYVNSGRNPSKELYKAKYEQASGMLYFRLTINSITATSNLLKNNLKDKDEYFQRLYYVSYEMKDDIKMMNGNRTYNCQLYHYERAYDLDSKISIMLGFEKPESFTEDVTIELRPAIINMDVVKLKFKGSVLRSAPKLQLQ